MAACCRRGPGDFHQAGPLIPTHSTNWKRLRFPGFLVALLLSPCSQTPVGPLRPRQQRTLRCCLLEFQSHRLLHNEISGLNHTARAFAVYASQPESPLSTQDSLLTCWLSFGHAELSSAGQRCKVSGLHWILLPLCQNLAWRNETAHALIIAQLLAFMHQARRAPRTGCTGTALMRFVFVVAFS